MTNTLIPMVRSTRALAGLLMVATCVLTGCQADYAADITNRTSQPVFVSILRKGSSQAVLGDSRRLGPGDRASIGPVRNGKDYGAYLSVDTMGNPNRPVTADLLPGESYFEIQQDGQGPTAPIHLIPKP